MLRRLAALLPTLLLSLSVQAGAVPHTCSQVDELHTLLNCASNSPQAGCKQVLALQQDLKCAASMAEADESDIDDAASDAKGNDFLVKKKFGPTTCYASNLIESKTEELTKKCEKWTQSKQNELKKRYRTSTCEETCNDCSAGLKKCEVNGVVHYKSI